MRLATTVALATIFFVSSAAAQDVVDLPAIKDNTLYEDSGGNYSNGAGQHLFAGKTARNEIRRALAAFDLSALPAGAIVDSVHVLLTMNKSLGASHQVHLHRVTREWGEGTSDSPGEEGGGTTAVEGDATWLHAFRPGTSWTNAGGDFLSLESASISVGNTGRYTWYSTSFLVDDVNHWLDNPAENFGWLIMGNEINASSAQRFTSRDNADTAAHPTLRVFYSGTATHAESNTQPGGWTLDAAWPNPFTTTTTVAIHSDAGGPVRMDVFDIQGRSVLSSSRFVQPGYQELELDGSTWGPGLFLVRISGQDQTRSLTLLKTQ